ncbi:MAG TPA: hypothetical protein VNO70_17045, partial [Blastocatellia bacterium]|nr:hypothetical protein [Blastocatellia bacterium]
NRLNTSISVSLYDGDTLIATVLANGSRPDVGAYLGDNGLHGFAIPTPNMLRTGTHTVRVRFESSSQDLIGSPRTITCGNPNYEGYVDYLGCDFIGGWAADHNRLNTSITVSLYDGAMLVATVQANQHRPDVGAYLGDNGLHGFTIPTPAALRGGTHAIYLRFEGSAQDLGGSPQTLMCSSANYAGYVDYMDCGVIAGWAADRNRLNTPITVSIYDGTLLIATVTADQSRPDVGAHLGDNGLHGFSVAMPSALRGGTHAIYIRFEGSNQDLSGSPRTLTCSSASYEGYVDYLGCDFIGGWAADHNRLNTSITVSLYDGSTLLATVTANGSRPDVGTHLGDNGLHGFTIPTPPALRNSQLHTVRIRFEGSGMDLGSSPRTLICSQ